MLLKGKLQGLTEYFLKCSEYSRNQFGDYHSVRHENWRVREMPGGMAADIHSSNIQKRRPLFTQKLPTYLPAIPYEENI